MVDQLDGGIGQLYGKVIGGCDDKWDEYCLLQSS